MNIDKNFKSLFKPYRFSKPIRFIVVYFIVINPFFLQAQEIECDDAFYLITQNIQANTSSFYKVIRANGSISTQLIKADLGRLLNASGYRVRDKMMYAIDQNTYEVVQIDATGNIQSWGVPQYLDTVNYTYQAADMAIDGSYFMVVGRNKITGVDDKIFNIIMNPNNFLVGIVNISGYGDIQLDDVAFSPIYGTVYGYDNNSRQLITVSDFSGQVSIISNAPSTVTAMGGLFFDKTGTLYGFGRQGIVEDKTFYSINHLNGIITAITNDVNSILSDGCSCPYSIKLNKRVSTSETVPCSEVFFTYEIYNQVGLHASPTLKDSFPPEYMITGFSDNTFPIVANINGIGTNQLEITNLPLPLGLSKISFTVEIDQNANGVYEHHASLSSLSLAMGETIFSDNPQTATPNDKTKVTILDLDNILANQIPYLCEGDTATLTTHIQGGNYEWSTGSTTNSTKITTAGWYALTVTTDCIIVTDSIFIPESPQSLIVDLGADQSIELGETIQLDYLTNGIGNIQLTWRSSNTTPLSCTTCPNPSIQPTERTLVYLDIVDQAFCKATDSILINIQPFRAVFMPTAFTPNFDGINDYFYVQGKRNAVVKRLLIADRWGNILFQNENTPINEEWDGWDGTSNGKVVSSGVYIWYAEIEFLDGVIQQYQGEVTIVR